MLKTNVLTLSPSVRSLFLRASFFGNYVSERTPASEFRRSIKTFTPEDKPLKFDRVDAATTGRSSGVPVATKPLDRVERIILVRHGESLGNVDEASYETIADWIVPLTVRGKRQARSAGRTIQQLLAEGDKDGDSRVHFYVSPYLRTRQTLRGILTEVERHRVVGLREEPRMYVSC